MIIDISCGEIINSKEVYIHDSILDKFCFNRSEKKLHLTILKDIDNKAYSIDFLNVIGFEMTSCDFWGASPYIFDFEYVEYNEQIIIPKLFNKNNNNDGSFCTLSDREKYIETVITFTSGDQLRVACESIII